MVLFLFGISGSGKTHIGELLADALAWPHYHADDDITEAMKNALKAHQPFTNAMRDDYFKIVVAKLRQLIPHTPNLIVTQACYKQRHRDYLSAQINELQLLHIEAEESTIFERLRSRAQGITPESAKALWNDFEFPPAGSACIQNNAGSKAAIEQFSQWASGRPDVFSAEVLQRLEAFAARL